MHAAAAAAGRRVHNQTFSLTPSVKVIRMFCSSVNLQEKTATALMLTDERAAQSGLQPGAMRVSSGLGPASDEGAVKSVSVVLFSIMYEVEPHFEAELTSQMVRCGGGEVEVVVPGGLFLCVTMHSLVLSLNTAVSLLSLGKHGPP